MRLDEGTAAGVLSLERPRVRDAIHTAERDGVGAEVIAALRAQERELASAVIRTLTREGSLLDALVGTCGGVQ